MKDFIISVGIFALSSLIFWVVISGIIDSIKYSPKKQDRIRAMVEERLNGDREALQQEYEKMKAQLQKDFEEKKSQLRKEFEAEKRALYAVVEEELAITESERKRLQAKLKALPKDTNELYLPARFVRDDKSLWNVNPLFFTPEDRQKYIEALDEPITRRAFTEFFLFEGLSVIKDSEPYDASSVVYSLKENGETHRYITELYWCDCPYYQKQHKICKHMMALAMKVGAVTIDVDEVLERK